MTEAHQTSEAPPGLIARFIAFWRSITVEPIVITFIISLYLMSLTDQNMYLEKACHVNQNYSADVCARLLLRETDGLEE